MPVCISGEIGTGKRIVLDMIISPLDLSSILFLRNVSAQGLLPNNIDAEKILVIDGIDEMDINIQKYIFALLSSRHSTSNQRPRIITVSTKSLSMLFAEGGLYEPLYYLVNAFELKTLPLRDRREDLPMLIDFYTNEFNKENATNFYIDDECREYMGQLKWPLNLLQLESSIVSLLVTSTKSGISRLDFENKFVDEKNNFVYYAYEDIVNNFKLSIDLPLAMENIEKLFIQRAIDATSTQVEAAALLNISKSHLQYKLKKYKITI
jgi:DNA-binding NtrC family response regulator